MIHFPKYVYLLTYLHFTYFLQGNLIKAMDHQNTKLHVQTMVEFDENIGELFKTVFYSSSKDFAGRSSETTGIVSHFLRNWKSTVEGSNLSKMLPAILTGKRATVYSFI